MGYKDNRDILRDVFVIPWTYSSGMKQCMKQETAHIFQRTKAEGGAEIFLRGGWYGLSL
jgi:hypothetical protein